MERRTFLKISGLTIAGLALSAYSRETRGDCAETGGLIQGDCGDGEVHRQMLDDVMNMFKAQFGALPFVTVAGNYDIRGVDARKTYEQYMLLRMSQELGVTVPGTTFSFNVGDSESPTKRFILR